jgi:BirA family biotin operon repressor/biotin-[acetyl-CoA-carboxylase] ligase
VSALTFQALRRIADGHFHSGEEVARSLGRSRAALSQALKRCADLGVELFSVPGKGYRLAEPIEFLDAGRVASLMGACAARVAIEIVDECDSTSTRLLGRAAAGAPTGTCLAAEWQSAGRGRRGRPWLGGLGGSLFFSLLWRFDRGAGHLAGLSLAVGVAVARALREAGVGSAQVKWPNDVVVGFRKIAGILTETSGEMQGPSVAVIGVGVNVRLPESLSERIDQPATDVARSAGAPASRNALLASLLAQLVDVLDLFERSGFAPLRNEWRALHAFQGRRARIIPAREAPYDADIVDVADDGTLLVSVGGRTLKLTSAEIEGSDHSAPSLPRRDAVRGS